MDENAASVLLKHLIFLYTTSEKTILSPLRSIESESCILATHMLTLFSKHKYQFDS